MHDADSTKKKIISRLFGNQVMPPTDNTWVPGYLSLAYVCDPSNIQCENSDFQGQIPIQGHKALSQRWAQFLLEARTETWVRGQRQVESKSRKRMDPHEPCYKYTGQGTPET